MQSLESQGYVTADWVNGQIASNLSPVWTAINDLGSYVANTLTPRIENAHLRITQHINYIHNILAPQVQAIETDLTLLETYVYADMFNWIQTIDQDLAIVEQQIQDIVAPDLSEIEGKIASLEDAVNVTIAGQITELDTRITDLQSWVGTSLANLAAYVDTELGLISDSVTHIINVSLPTITLKISSLENSITVALLSISEQFSLTTIERRAWDRFPEVAAAQWLGIYKNVFPEYKNILKLWLARILQ